MSKLESKSLIFIILDYLYILKSLSEKFYSKHKVSNIFPNKYIFHTKSHLFLSFSSFYNIVNFVILVLIKHLFTFFLLFFVPLSLI